MTLQEILDRLQAIIDDDDWEDTREDSLRRLMLDLEIAQRRERERHEQMGVSGA